MVGWSICIYRRCWAPSGFWTISGSLCLLSALLFKVFKELLVTLKLKCLFSSHLPWPLRHFTQSDTFFLKITLFLSVSRQPIIATPSSFLLMLFLFTLFKLYYFIFLPLHFHGVLRISASAKDMILTTACKHASQSPACLFFQSSSVTLLFLLATKYKLKQNGLLWPLTHAIFSTCTAERMLV